MKIDVNKKYALNGEPITVIGMDGDTNVVIRTKRGYCPVDVRELVEVNETCEPREWDVWTNPSGSLLFNEATTGDKIRVREIPPTTNLTPEWRELGPDEVLQEGDEVTAWDEYTIDCKREDSGWIKTSGGIGKTVYEHNMRARRRVASDSKSVLQKEEKFNVFPEVGARLRFTKIPFFGIHQSQKVGDEITVEQVGEEGFTAGGWDFERDWQEGLEVVTESSIPQIIKDTEKVRDALSHVSEEERQSLLDYALEQSKQPPIPEGFLPVPEIPGFKRSRQGWKLAINNKRYLMAKEGDEYWCDSETSNASSIGYDNYFYIELIPLVEPLQLEAGKYYLNRKGEKVGPIVKTDGLFGLLHKKREWYKNGKRSFSYEDPGDLVSLAPDEEPPTIPKEEEFDHAAAKKIGEALYGEPQASYPPPESEWPEKPDPGEGMVWERVKNNETVGGGVGIITGKRKHGRGEAYWYRWETPNSGYEFGDYVDEVFRAVPAPVTEDPVNRTEESTTEGFAAASPQVAAFISGLHEDPEVGPRRYPKSPDVEVTLGDWVLVPNRKAEHRIVEINWESRFVVTDNDDERWSFDRLTFVRHDVEPDDPEEARAKAVLPEGWLWFGKGPLKHSPKGYLFHVAMWMNSSKCWNRSGNSGRNEFFYAIRSGTELARQNGLEKPCDEKQWRFLEPSEIVQDGDWVKWGSGGWEEATGSVGDLVSKCCNEFGKMGFKARRRITEGELSIESSLDVLKAEQAWRDACHPVDRDDLREKADRLREEALNRRGRTV